ncbi:MAG: DUF2071 domain-containing protein [Fimbriimonadaceae bacterium]|nr:DUF2071 domain-containing protein [Fimbriimonadaceae bacterium]
MVELAEYESLRLRPQGRPELFQRWHDLTFLHFAVAPELVQQSLPSSLTVDTYPDENGQEMAWIGLVPFHMSGIRWPGTPALPWLSAFPETNVRTYVHRDGKRPGVWFYSLEAARWLACKYARLIFKLPYYNSKMSVEKHSGFIKYQNRRLESPKPADLQIEAKPTGELETATPGTFEFFLIERYLLYSRRGDKLYTGQVWHQPYRLQNVELLQCQQNVTDRIGFPGRSWTHLAFSPGVEVEVFSLNEDVSPST